MLLVVGTILLLAIFGNSRKSRARSIMCLLATVAGLIYLDWRLGQTGVELIGSLPADRWAESVWLRLFLGVEILGMAEFFQFMLTMSRYRENRAQADVFEQRLRALPPESLPDVDVWIATYDESWQILEK